MMTFQKPVLGFAAYSGTGKTTLLVRLLPLLKKQGLRIAMIKHSHHDFEIDIPGKDSYELRKAGAQQMLLASAYREALVTERTLQAEPELQVLISRLDLTETDLVLVEGFRHVTFPKIELHRESLGKPLLCAEDSSIIAVATDKPLEIDALPQLDINNPAQIAQYVMQWYRQQPGQEVIHGTGSKR